MDLALARRAAATPRSGRTADRYAGSCSALATVSARQGAAVCRPGARVVPGHDSRAGLARDRRHDHRGADARRSRGSRRQRLSPDRRCRRAPAAAAPCRPAGAGPALCRRRRHHPAPGAVPRRAGRRCRGGRCASAARRERAGCAHARAVQRRRDESGAAARAHHRCAQPVGRGRRLRSARPEAVLDSADLDRAVALGAAHYGLARRGRGIRIRGGAARTYYVGIESAMPAVPGLDAPVRALCVVPFGMEEGTEADDSRARVRPRRRRARGVPLSQLHRRANRMPWATSSTNGTTRSRS